jgi:hypothetical protein
MTSISAGGSSPLSSYNRTPSLRSMSASSHERTIHNSPNAASQFHNRSQNIPGISAPSFDRTLLGISGPTEVYGRSRNTPPLTANIGSGASSRTPSTAPVADNSTEAITLRISGIKMRPSPESNTRRKTCVLKLPGNTAFADLPRCKSEQVIRKSTLSQQL